MSLRQSVLNGIDSAFNAIGDLAVSVLLNPKQSNGYDFSTGLTSISSGSSVSLKAVVLGNDKDGKRLMIKKTDLPRPDLYDTVELEGRTYRIGEKWEDDDWLVYLTLFDMGVV